jgi:hypothetical protein
MMDRINIWFSGSFPSRILGFAAVFFPGQMNSTDPAGCEFAFDSDDDG